MMLYLSIIIIPFLLNADSARVLTTRAFDLEKGSLLYTEIRTQLDSGATPGRWMFEYRDGAGRLIVTRQVDFSNDKIRPDFELRDLRNGYREGAETVADKIRVFSGGSPDDPYQEKVLSVPGTAVVDAGFNFFVRDNFDRLLNGEKVTFNFVAPSQLDYFGFRIYKEDIVQYAGKTAVKVKMDIDNFFLRLFVDPIVVLYDRQSRELLRYEGISNIYNDKGRSYNVKMEFQNR